MSDSKNNSADVLFEPVKLGKLELKHRVIMAPLTRMRATLPGCVPNDLNAEYYAQRASEGGLLISEATHIARSGQGYWADPGIFSDEQVEGWKKVTKAVHEKKGLIYLQLWHVGRVSHSSYGQQAVAPSAIALTKNRAIFADGTHGAHEQPRAATKQDIKRIIEEYRKGTENALRAGFDGVEIHGANGYLIDQFLEDNSNIREDEYGGSIENRTRFLIEVLHAVIEAAGDTEKVGIRLSPWGSFGEMGDSNKHKLFTYVLSRLDQYRLAYVHLNAPEIPFSDIQKLKQDAKYTTDNIIVCGSLTRDTAIELVKTGVAKAAVFGRLYISNPDLPLRLQHDLPLTEPDVSTFYGGNEKGYTDYPFAKLAKS